MKRLLCTAILIFSFCVPVFAAEPFAPIYVMGNINFRNGDNLSFLPATNAASFEAGLGSPASYGTFSYDRDNHSFLNNFDATNVSGGFIRLSPLNGTYFLREDQYYVIRFMIYDHSADAKVSFSGGLNFFDSNWNSPKSVIYSHSDTLLFYPTEDWVLNNSYVQFQFSKTYPSVGRTQFEVYYFSIQALVGFTRADDPQDVIAAIENQTDAMQDHWSKVDQDASAAVPDQWDKSNSDLDNAASDLHSVDETVFNDINTYKGQLDFGLNSWSDAASGLSYVGNIFLILWDNIPTQPIVLALMLGLASLLLGRGAALARRAGRGRGGGDDDA